MKEGNAYQKFGIAAQQLWRELLQKGLQDLHTALGELIDVPVWFSFLVLHLSLHCTHLFKALESRIEHLVVERDSATESSLNVLFDFVAVPWPCSERGQNDNFCIH